ncbi:hypothetical protein [Bernardetia sp.]|uniref:hypothetical protein n=1 Tax=Bernardetia sp. TaxID=1937974 RepID=UPI0025BF4AB6|nr:hypothetical protein [Bernardetia sp.]
MLFKKIITAFVGQTDTSDGITIRFGRYSDAHKTLEKYDAWARSTSFFEQKNYLQAYLEFFNYLLDDDESNLSYETVQVNEGGDITDFKIDFTLQQGSKIVRGFANSEEFVGEVKLVKIKDNLHVALGRRLMEMNYELLYSGFSLDENGVIWIRFTTNTVDSFAGKLYNGLREIATRSDSQDDLLLSEFKNQLEAIDDKHIEYLSEEQQQVKLRFLKKWIKETLEKVKTLHTERLASAISYMLLTLLYRIDYLLTPEGTLTAILEDIHKIVFYDQNRLPVQRNDYAIKEFEKILTMSDKELLLNFYETKSTFGIAKPAYEQDIKEIIEKQLQAALWFEKNDQEHLTPFVFEYIAGYCLFNYGLARPTKECLHLYFQIIHADFFDALGAKHTFADTREDETVLNKNLITKRIDFILETWRQMYPHLFEKTPKISYKNFTNFSSDYFSFVKDLKVSN